MVDMNRRLLAPLGLLPLMLGACPADPKPPTVSLMACRLDEDTAREMLKEVARLAENDLAEAEAMLADPDMREFAEEEMA